GLIAYAERSKGQSNSSVCAGQRRHHFSVGHNEIQLRGTPRNGKQPRTAQRKAARAQQPLSKGHPTRPASARGRHPPSPQIGGSPPPRIGAHHSNPGHAATYALERSGTTRTPGRNGKAGARTGTAAVLLLHPEVRLHPQRKVFTATRLACGDHYLEPGKPGYERDHNGKTNGHDHLSNSGGSGRQPELAGKTFRQQETLSDQSGDALRSSGRIQREDRYDLYGTTRQRHR